MRSLVASLTLLTGTTAFTPIQPTATSIHRTMTSSSSSLSAVPAKSNFLTPELTAACIAAASGTPLYAYSLPALESAATSCLAFPNSYGLTVRYAMKACPNGSILKYFLKRGIHIDASSGYEVRRAMDAGYAPDQISLSSQELPVDEFVEFVEMGVKINACSIHQLECIGRAFEGRQKNVKVGIRINPGVGSGGFSSSTTGFSKTNVGGPSSSFGIWHESVTDGTVPSIVDKYGLIVERIHTHIGSGSDPQIWQSVASRSLSFCKLWDTVTSMNLGGGYKVGRNPEEITTDLQSIGGPVADAFRSFAEETGRELKLEIEPGTYLVANAGALVATIQDKVTTSDRVFLKMDAGMTDVLRPSLYGAIHPITILPGSGRSEDVGDETENVVVVGHCCESGDLMTPKPGDPEALEDRTLRKAEIGDVAIMDGSGAYCSGMSTKNYNSFPEAPEVLVTEGGEVHLIRKRQSLKQIYENECDAPESVLSGGAAVKEAGSLSI